jgi:hypothetical protein
MDGMEAKLITMLSVKGASGLLGVTSVKERVGGESEETVTNEL